MSAAHRLEAAGVDALGALSRALPWPVARAAGSGVGALAGALGIRRRVAIGNLAIAFPERTADERDRILAAHYRELGRVAFEYGQLARLVHAAGDTVVAEARGMAHLETLRGRGAILMTGHFGAFELLGAWLGRLQSIDFVVRPLSNPLVEARLQAIRAAAGVGRIDAADPRRVYTTLARGGWVCMLADQDARRSGVFVPFFGRPASTPAGPARIALKAGVPIVMGFATRRADGRLELDVEAPLAPPAAGDPDPVRTLTLAHTARLEHWIRRTPEQWFWLHRRWKTRPPDDAAPERAPGASPRADAAAGTQAPNG